MRREWAMVGLGGGIAAAIGLFASASTSAAAEPEDFKDPAILLPKLVEGRAWVLVFQIAMTLAALALLIFAAGLHRHLAGQEPAGSLVPQVAAAGLGLTAALSLVGAGIATELWWTLGEPAEASPTSAASMLDIVATFSWVWAGVALTAGALAAAALRRGSLPRWIGRISALAAALILLVSLLPVQYMAGMLGALWLIATAAGLAFERTTSPVPSTA